MQVVEGGYFSPGLGLNSGAPSSSENSLQQTQAALPWGGRGLVADPRQHHANVAWP